MELFDIIGIQHKSGVFDGKNYDNMIFSVTRSADSSKGEQGLIVSQLKIKTELLESIPNIGDTVQPIYDRYGRCIGFQN